MTAVVSAISCSEAGSIVIWEMTPAPVSTDFPVKDVPIGLIVLL